MESLRKEAALEAALDEAAMRDLAARAWELAVPAVDELAAIDGPMAAEIVDRLLVTLARRFGAIELAMGSRLARLEDRGVVRLGFSGIGDLGAERLGISRHHARDLARLARSVRSRPLLRAAVQSGDVGARKAAAILPVAVGEDEAHWVERARAVSTRALEREVAAIRGAPPEEETERVKIHAVLGVEGVERLAVALELAAAARGRGAVMRPWEGIEAFAMEYLATHPPDRSPTEGELRDEGVGPALVNAGAAEEPRGAEPGTVADTDVRGEAGSGSPDPGVRWDGRSSEGPDVRRDAVRPEGPGGRRYGTQSQGPDVRRDGAQELLELARIRAGWDELVGHLALLAVRCGIWRTAQFASFGHYCAERLGLKESAVRQRVALERKLYELPALRTELRERRLSYEKARMISRVADPGTVDDWIEKARALTCIELERLIDDGAAATARKTGEVDIVVPSDVAATFLEACEAARLETGRWLDVGECLLTLVIHFEETWAELIPRVRASRRRILERDRGFCRVPGCSRAAQHIHHIEYRSHTHNEQPSNLVSLCAIHHLRGVHAGNLVVKGLAPDQLTWILGEKEVRAERERSRTNVAA